MRVLVRLFARLREEAGADRVELILPEGARTEDAWRALAARHPTLAGHRGALAAARNRRYADWDEPLGEGDEIAFIPPVSGGSR
jgi:molybdopterin synthase catalytic subunit